MDYYRHKAIPDAKFEFDSCSIFGEMTSQAFLSQEGNKSLNSDNSRSENGFNFQ